MTAPTAECVLRCGVLQAHGRPFVRNRPLFWCYFFGSPCASTSQPIFFCPTLPVRQEALGKGAPKGGMAFAKLTPSGWVDFKMGEKFGD